ncbi:MAG: hypothetical protein GDA49_12910 [Rhodospirillales bacterium]|nr:hypothetical protein [Rhodospirillales bacterium]
MMHIDTMVKDRAGSSHVARNGLASLSGNMAGGPASGFRLAGTVIAIFHETLFNHVARVPIVGIGQHGMFGGMN